MGAAQPSLFVMMTPSKHVAYIYYSIAYRTGYSHAIRIISKALGRFAAHIPTAFASDTVFSKV